MSLTHSLSSFRPALYLEPMKLESLPSEHSKDSAVFVVRGITIGNTNLYFNATLHLGRVVTSSAKEVQVYSPLRLSPTHIWLVTGAVFKVWSRCMRRGYCVCACVHVSESSKLVALLVFWFVKQDPGCRLVLLYPPQVCVFSSSFPSSLSRFTALGVHLKLMLCTLSMTH